MSGIDANHTHSETQRIQERVSYLVLNLYKTKIVLSDVNIGGQSTHQYSQLQLLQLGVFVDKAHAAVATAGGVCGQSTDYPVFVLQLHKESVQMDRPSFLSATVAERKDGLSVIHQSFG